MSDRYRLTRLFAKGGMAEVYLGASIGAEGFEKPVAIKRMLPHLAQDERVAKMFLSEAKLATFLSHQNIVQVFDVGRAPDGLFIVMELVNGWDLGVVIEHASRKGLTFSPTLAAFVASQAMAGLGHAYRQTHGGKALVVAHRDISPSNLLISAEGEVKVADFGIARLEAFSNRTEPGTFKGKIAYGAPEVLRGHPASQASDQFAMGICLQEMLTGVHPFGTFENAMSYVESILNHPPAPMPGVPQALTAIVMRALSKSQADRFESPDLFARALARFLATTGTPATTHELAEFVRRLDLPKVPSELPPQHDTVIRGALPGSAPLPQLPQAQGVLTQMPSLHSNPTQNMGGLLGGTFQLSQSVSAEELLQLNKDWAPTGPELDASGALDHSAIARPPAPSQVRPLHEEEPLELAYDPRQGMQTVVEQAPAAYVAPTFRPEPQASDITFHSESAKPEVTVSLEGVVKWLVVGLAVVAAAVAVPKLYRAKNTTPLLQIESVPEGATIRIANRELGKTPMFSENYFPEGPVELTVVLDGYKPWTGTFQGRVQATIKAMLVPLPAERTMRGVEPALEQIRERLPEALKEAEPAPVEDGTTPAPPEGPPQEAPASPSP